MTDQIAHHWHPITDLPEDWQAMADPTLPVLAEEWRKGRETVGDSAEIRRFNAELLREVAIETGLIEGLYSIDRGTTETLIRMGLIKEELAQGIIDRSADEIMPILEDQHSATEGLFDFVKQKRDLDTSYIKELHAHLTRHQPTTDGVTPDGQRTQIPLLRGDWKTQPNNPKRPDGGIHEYCPPEHVAAEMDRLIELHATHEAAGVAPDVSAAWLHHRFTQIHPFQDGNGRVARSLASLVFLRAGWFLLDVTRGNRSDYIKALEIADSGIEKDLVFLFAGIQNSWFDRALTSLSKAEAQVLSQKEISRRINSNAVDRSGIVSPSDIVFRLKEEMFNHKIVDCVASILNENTSINFDDSFRMSKESDAYKKISDKFEKAGFLYFPEFGGSYLGFVSHKSEPNKVVPFIQSIKNNKSASKFYLDDCFTISATENRQIQIGQFKRWNEATSKWLVLEWERRR